MISQSLYKIALIGSYLPRKCGIATFTHDLCSALTNEGSGTECLAAPGGAVLLGNVPTP